MKNLLWFCVGFLLVLVLAGAAQASDAYPLHGGSKTVKASSGPRVAGLQWLLAGHKPSVFTTTKPTFNAPPNGYYGARTKAAVHAMKFRIGYPQKGQCGATANEVTDTAAQKLFDILEGKQVRPLCWVGLAAARIKSVVQPGVTTVAQKIKELEIKQLGTIEIPYDSNRGPRISYTADGFGPYQGSTGAFGLAWCASFADWAMKSVAGRGFGSANDAYVPTIVEYAQAHGWVQAKPRVGDYVVFLDRAFQLGSAYHIGTIISLVGDSGVETIEGNSNDAVREVYRPYGVYNMVYVEVPGVS